MPPKRPEVSWIEQALSLLQGWLVEQQARLSPEGWREVRDRVEKLGATVQDTMSREQTRSAERAILEFARENRVRALQELPPPSRFQDDVFRGDPVFRGADPTRAHADWRELLGGVLRVVRTPARAQPASREVSVFPDVRIPEVVALQQVFEVRVSTSPEAVTAEGAAMYIRAADNGPIDIEVEIVVSDPKLIAPRWPKSGLKQPLRVFEDGHSATMVFELRAIALGMPRVEVVFRNRDLPLARVSRKVTIAEAVAAAVPAAGEGVARAAQVPATAMSVREAPQILVLRVEAKPGAVGMRNIEVRLGGPKWSGAERVFRNEVPESHPAAMQQLCRALPGLRRMLPRVAEQKLQNAATQLAAEWLGQDIAEALLAFEAGTPLSIQSNDAWVPWEALYLTTGNKEGAFLGERFAASRHLDLQHQMRVRPERGVLCAPPGSNLDPATERSALQRLFGESFSELTEPDEILSIARTSGPRAIHFVCHAAHDAAPGAAFANGLVLDDNTRLSETDILSARQGTPGNLAGSLVFANACEAALPEPTIWGYGGLAERFLRAGAGAFLAPAWAVETTTAAAYAVAFYEQATSGQTTLAEAARRARLAIKQPGSVYRLGYALYAAPGAALEISTPAVIP